MRKILKDILKGLPLASWAWRPTWPIYISFSNLSQLRTDFSNLLYMTRFEKKRKKKKKNRSVLPWSFKNTPNLTFTSQITVPRLALHSVKLGKVTNKVYPFNSSKSESYHKLLLANKLQSRSCELGGVSLPGLGCVLVCIFQSMESCRPTSSHFVDCSFVCHKNEEDKEPWKNVLLE